MKRRLLAFLLAFVMTFSLVPVNTFAAEADAAAHYTKITTESGENVTRRVCGNGCWCSGVGSIDQHTVLPCDDS